MTHDPRFGPDPDALHPLPGHPRVVFSNEQIAELGLTVPSILDLSRRLSMRHAAIRPDALHERELAESIQRALG